MKNSKFNLIAKFNKLIKQKSARQFNHAMHKMQILHDYFETLIYSPILLLLEDTGRQNFYHKHET